MKTEKVFGGVFLISVIFKFYALPGASLLLSFSALTLTLIYFPFGFYFFSDKNLKNQNIVLSILGGNCLSPLVLGVLFKFMFWPGSAILLLIGLISTFILASVTFILSKKSNENLKTYYKNYITRIIFWITVGLIFYLLSSRQLLQIQHRNEPELAKLKINAYQNPENLEYQQALKDYYQKSDSLEMSRN